jgi:hypothetical protein
VATATKIIGIIAAPTLLVLFLQQEQVFRSGLWTAVKAHGLKLAGVMVVSVSGLLAYMAYLWMKFGDPLIFYKANKAWGRSQGGDYLTNIWGNYEHILDFRAYGSHINYLVALDTAIVPILALAIVIFALYKRIWWMAVYAFLMIALPLSTGTLMSVNRLALVLAPCAVYIFAIAPRRLYKYAWLLVCLMAVTEAILSTYFLQGSYFIG